MQPFDNSFSKALLTRGPNLRAEKLFFVEPKPIIFSTPIANPEVKPLITSATKCLFGCDDKIEDKHDMLIGVFTKASLKCALFVMPET